MQSRLHYGTIFFIDEINVVKNFDIVYNKSTRLDGHTVYRLYVFIFGRLLISVLLLWGLFVLTVCNMYVQQTATLSSCCECSVR